MMSDLLAVLIAVLIKKKTGRDVSDLFLDCVQKIRNVAKKFNPKFNEKISIKFPRATKKG